MGSDKTIDQQLQDLEAMPESELLVLPEANIPAGLLAAIWERTAVIKEKKQEDEAVLRLDTQERRVEQSKERARNEARELAFEQFQTTMHEVQERSEKLLERLAQREIVAREHLREIDERAIVLKDGRHVYVGRKGSISTPRAKRSTVRTETMPAHSISKIRWPQGGRRKPMPSSRSNKPCS
jgi:hypothetical protein